MEMSRYCIPYTPFRGRLEDSRVCLVSNAGVYMAGDHEAFNLKGDLSMRKVPSDTDSRRLAIAHEHYDHREADKDINLVFPIDRLRELVEERKIKSVTSDYLSKGYTQAMREVKERVAWEMAKEVDRMRPDLVLLTAG